MPRYDYRCEDSACETDTFEVTKGFHDDPAAACPSCGAAAKKLLSPIAVHFKGSGFYVTDNRASNGASSSTTDSSESKSADASSSDSGAEKKSESGTKTEKKAEKKADTPSKPAETKPAKAAVSTKG